ncbi:PREDICTED: probable gamma-secretase subunit PEN-2, partial [Fragaria vesca subsp. vesca]|uniref:probable gamma-secretase subunit PEN-2 n=1 Tax=Fragaria vesca subsp. vesca TaxID=101020 RepID=UPI0002C33FC6
RIQNSILFLSPSSSFWVFILRWKPPPIPQTLTRAQGFSSPCPLPPLWPTIDGPLGLSEEESVSYARRFYKFGFALLPLLWAVNCFYFWPALRNSRSFPLIHHYVLRSAVGFAVFTALLSSWALTFGIGGERLFGHVWDELVMYNLADRLGLTGWS